MSHDQHAHDEGLAADMAALTCQILARRRFLGLMGVAGAGALSAAACGGGGSSEEVASSGSSSTSGGSGGSSTTGSSCIATPTETEGPYPADGSNSSNGVVRNVLAQTGVVRSDIRSSFAGVSSNVAGGVTLNLTIRLANTNTSCAALAGYAIYLWHCTREGQYSLYDLPNENYLRGVGVTDSDGLTTFTTIFPGCYAGRWPHMHFEVYPTLPLATGYANKILTSQLAMPADICSAVYSNVSGYSGSASNYRNVSLASDGIFRDNTSAQVSSMTPTFSGDYGSNYSASVQIGLPR